MKRFILIQTVFWTFNSKAQVQQPLLFNFDTIEPVYIDTNLSNNIWQIGKPYKLFFDDPFTYPRAILTDSVNFYPINNLSEFMVKTPTYMSGMGGVNMSFVHKFDTDSLQDGGTIHVSGDGVNWTTLLNSPAYFLPALYNPFPSNDTITSLNDVGFSGKSNGWQQFWCYWNYPPTDTLWIKFIFASDGIQTNKEGWMIDSLIFQYDLGIGVDELVSNSFISVCPNPNTGIFNIEIKDVQSTKYDVQCKIFDLTGKEVHNKTITKNQSIVNIEHLPNGMYFIQLIGEGFNVSKKIIIQR